MKERIVEEEPTKTRVFPDRIKYVYRVLTHVGGSQVKHSECHDEFFGGAEYEQIDDDDVEVEEYQLVSVTNLETSETVHGPEAQELAGDLLEWYGSFFEAGFTGSRPHEFIVPAPEDEHDYRVEYEHFNP